MFVPNDYYYQDMTVDRWLTSLSIMHTCIWYHWKTFPAV